MAACLNNDAVVRYAAMSTNTNKFSCIVECVGVWVIPYQMSRSCDSRLPILLQFLIYVGLDIKVTCTIILLMVYKIHATE